MALPTIRGPEGEPSFLMRAIDHIAYTHNDDTVEWGFGRQVFSEHASARRVTLVPTVSRFGRIRDAGVALRVLDTGVLSVTDEDHGKAERLMHEVLRACFASSVANVYSEDQDGVYEWFTERQGESGLMVRTPMLLCELRFRVDLPIDDPGTFIVADHQFACRWVTSLDPDDLPAFPTYIPPT